MNNPLEEDFNHILAHTCELWEELRGQKIFITGGTGFFGCWLLDSFSWANEKLNLNAAALVLTRDLKTFREKAPHLTENQAIKFHIGDVQSFEFPKNEFSHIIHAATTSSVTLNQEDPLQMFDTINEGTRRTLDFARFCGAKKFLLTSSGAVYGRQPPEITHIPEDYQGAPDPMDPSSAYGEGKRAAEFLCTIYAKQYGLETKIARCFAFVGPHLPLERHFAIGNFIYDGLNGRIINVKGDGTPFRSYLYTADLAIWLWTILFKGQSCVPYNVGSERDISIAKLAQIVSQAFKHKPDVRIVQIANPKKLPERYVPSVEKAKRELKLDEWIDLNVAIKRTINWYQSMKPPHI
jgi:dTDP-glucose 4,6-dehydratase